MFNRVFERSSETFDIDGLGKYTCPRFMAGKDIIEIRYKHLTQDRSKTNDEFENWINKIFSKFDKGAFGCIREFPFPITNKQLYQDIVFNIGGRTLLNKAGTNYFFITDYLFYNLGLIVELDSHWHDDKRELDLARDLYLEREYGLETLRIDGYGVRNDPKADKKFQEKLLERVDEILSYKKSLHLQTDSHVIINFSDYLNNRYVLADEYTWKMIAEISEDIAQHVFPVYDKSAIQILRSSLKPGHRNWL